MIGAEREGSDGIEADIAGAVGVEQFGGELAEAQALLDVSFGSAEALCDLIDRGAAVDQLGHGDKFVGGVHRGADRVFDKRAFERVAGAFDLARDRMIGIDRAFGGELLQDLEPPSAGIDFVEAFVVGRHRMDDQVLFDAMGADAGFERRILGRRGRGFADIARGENELAEGDVADFAASGHGGRLLRRAGARRLSPWKTRHKSPFGPLPLSPSAGTAAGGGGEGAPPLGPITGGFGGHGTVALRLLWPRLIDAWSAARSSWAMRLAIATIRAVCGAFSRWPRGGWQKWVGPRRSNRSQAASVARLEH